MTSREKSIEKSGVVFSQLQLAGVGYKKIEMVGQMAVIDPQTKFEPPSRENFMDFATGTLMTTNYRRNGAFTNTKPQYRPKGTYSWKEFVPTVLNTNRISKLALKNIVVPHVEAYGRYLDEILSYDGCPFGFLVFPLPGKEVTRTVDYIVGEVDKAVQNRWTHNPLQLLLGFADEALEKAMPGIREINDHRIAHLQSNLGQWYPTKPPYLVDWTTMKELGNSPWDQAYNRTIDIRKAVDTFAKVAHTFFPNIQENIWDAIDFELLALALGYYLRTNIPKEVLLQKQLKAAGRVGTSADYIDAASQMIYDNLYSTGENPGVGIGIIQPDTGKSTSKVGRNDPCPCKSGKKYKKCCGHFD